ARPEIWIDLWYHHSSVAIVPGVDWRLNRLVSWRLVGWRSKGQGDVEISSVESACNVFLNHFIHHFASLSGYCLFILVNLTVHLGGAWSSWSLGQTPIFVRLIAYTAAPTVLILTLF